MIHRAKFTGHKDCPDVVIKRLKDPYNQDADFVQMLADEAELMNQMRHSNIVKVHEFGQVGGQYFLATEYVDGVNLRQILRRLQRQHASMKCSVALFLLREALVGLHYAHQFDESLVHRDFTPSNVMIGFDGAVKLIDFGIAKSKLARTKTRGGVIKGKLKYMSPEQTKGAQMTPRSDQFSAGAVVYEVMTGVQPFDGASDADVIRTIRHDKPSPPSLLNAGLDHDFDRIVEKALSKNPASRYPSIGEFEGALCKWMAKNDIGAVRRDLASFVSHLFEDERREREMYLGSVELGNTSEPTSGYTRIAGTGYFLTDDESESKHENE